MNLFLDSIYRRRNGRYRLGSRPAFAHLGAKDVLAARNAARLKERASELAARAVPMEATHPEAAARAFDAALGEGHRLLGVVNCIGTIFLKPVHVTSD